MICRFSQIKVPVVWYPYLTKLTLLAVAMDKPTEGRPLSVFFTCFFLSLIPFLRGKREDCKEDNKEEIGKEDRWRPTLCE